MERREAPATVDPGEAFECPADQRSAGEPVPNSRPGGCEWGESVDVFHEQVAKGPDSTGVIGMEELGFELRHIHIAGALALARLARQAKIHDLRNPSVGQRRARSTRQGTRWGLLIRSLWFPPAALECDAQGVGPGPGGVLLVTGDTVRGAHGPALGLATHPDPVAQFDTAEEAALAGIVKRGGWVEWDRAGANPEVLIHRRPVDHFSGIQNVTRIEPPFDHPKRLVHHRTEHLAIPLGSHHPIAVLSTEAPPERLHEIGHIHHDRSHLPHVRRVMEIQNRADVQAADRSVAVECPVRSVPVENLPELPGKLR